MQCSICGDDRIEQIEAERLRGTPLRKVAELFGLSKSALHRHESQCRPSPPAEVVPFEAARPALDLLTDLQAKLLKAIGKLERSNSHGVLVQAIREARGFTIELARLQGQLSPPTQIQADVLKSPQWTEIEAALMEELEAVPEVRARIAARLLALAQGDE